MAEPTSPSGSTRRGLFKTLTGVLGAAIGVALTVPAIRALIYPASAKTVEGSTEPVDVGATSAVAVGAAPVRVEVVVKSQRDAWSKQSDVRLGAAWLVRDAGGALKAFSATCPHLGCAIDWDGQGTFRCPCHTSAFGPDGEKKGGPAKRGLDPLEVSEVDGRIKLRFTRFIPDVADRKPA